MSKAITTQATNLSLSGVDLTSPDAMLTIAIIIEEQSKTRKGGLNFNSGVLFTKVCQKVKSLAGNIERLPEEVAEKIKSIISEMPEATTKRLAQEGWTAQSLSPIKVGINYKTAEVSRKRSMGFSQTTSLEMQIKDVIWANKQLDYRRICLEAKPVEDSQEKQVNADKVKSIEAQMAKNQSLLMALKARQVGETK